MGLGIAATRGAEEVGPEDLALVQRSQAASNLMKMKFGWILIYEDSTSSLFAAQDWPQLDTLIHTAQDFEPIMNDGQFP